MMHIRRAIVDDAWAVADIYNEGIAARSATFETELRSADDRRRVISAQAGRGLGRALMSALVAEATRLGYWKLVSRAFLFNAASRAMCRRAGFREVGVYERHAQLDGAWLDVVIVERLIPENQRT